MKLYKVWVEVEEQDLDEDAHRSLSEEGVVPPVLIATFSDLVAATRFAESLGLDTAEAPPPTRRAAN